MKDLLKYPEYPKINSLYMRDSKTKKFTKEFACPEFGLINSWKVYEKIDGTNIRVFYIPATEEKEAYLYINGRTNNAEVPSGLMDFLINKFNVNQFIENFGSKPVCFFGEGIGKKIQSSLYGDDFDFILFDIKIGEYWLDYINIVGIANIFQLKVVTPIFLNGTLSEIEEYVKFTNPNSMLNSSVAAEGVVCHPLSQLFDRKGNRVMFKLKVKDFK